MATWAWILIAIAVVVVIALVAVATRQRKTAELRRRFGPEYDRVVEASEDRRAAEADLREREKWRAQLDITPLPEDMRVRYAQEWQDVQERFVDQPSEAVVAADRLIYRVMETRGYPVGDFDAQADLVSVDHPRLVENYRYAHGVHQQAQQASTEDLREALVRYRSLFDELLIADDDLADRDRVSRDRVSGEWTDRDRVSRDRVNGDRADRDRVSGDQAAAVGEGDPGDEDAAGITAGRGPSTAPDRQTRPADESEVPYERP
jgi:hypothetical protein